jgi:hypothetical protein
MKRNPPRLTPGGEWSQDTLCIWVIRLTFYLTPAGRARLGFLGASLFGFGTSAFEPWILLDFLGFSRPNRAFSMGYAAKGSELFFVPLRPCCRSARRGDCGRGVRKPRIAHEASLTRFPIFCKKLPALIALALGPRITAQPQRHGRASRGHPRLPAQKPQVALLEKLIISDDYARRR